MAAGKATLRDVAARARVSSTTASVVLSGRGEEFRIAPETRERVTTAARDLRYQPSGARRRRGPARATSLWSVFAASGIDVFPLRPFLDGVVGYLAQEDLPVSCALVEFERGRLRDKQQWLDPAVLDGAILVGLDDADLQFVEAGGARVPLVLYNRVAKGFPSVLVDDVQVGRAAATHFLSRAVGGFTVVSAPSATSAANLRMAGFSDVLLRAGVTGPLGMPFERVEIAPGGTFELDLPGDRHGPHGVFVLTDEVLPAVVDGLARSGIAVPDQAEVVSYGNSDASSRFDPAVTSASTPMRAVGSECAEVLRHAVAHPGVLRDVRRVFQADLVFRDSSPAPPR